MNPIPARNKINLAFVLILLGYAFISVLTPNMNALDSNGPKFLTLSVLNLFAYLIILIDYQLKHQKDIHGSFFRTWPGIIVCLFLLISILSFFKAFNIYESIINFSKLFTVFSAAYIVSYILRKDTRYLYVIAISLTLLLIIDSFTVYYFLLTKIRVGVDKEVEEIKSMYSNKNILSAAIFVKISFALWLLTFSKTWIKGLGGFALFVAFVATLFMSTRSFYVGIIFLIMAYVLFMYIRYYRENKKQRIVVLTVSLFGAIILGVFLFSAGLKYIFPQSSKSKYSVDIVSRLKSISPKEVAGGGQRLETWERSFKLIKSNPLLGVGLGNWKVEVLKYETPLTGAYKYMYKNHNDFIEIAAETGILGGILFICIFLLIYWNFLKAFFKAKKGEELSYTWLFLPAFGLFCYSFDAFFNFPSDRPEIISLFAIFVGAGVAYSPESIFVSRNASRVTNSFSPVTRHASRITLIVAFLALMIGSIYIFYLNFESLKLQLLAQNELRSGVFSSKSDVFLNGFPTIPNISVEGDPIAVAKARYLIVEQKYQQAIDLLKKDKSSPYDTRQEYLIAMAYLNSNQPDSALVYTDKVYKLKPYFSENISLMSNAYNAKGNVAAAIKVLEDHIKLNTKDSMPIAEIIYKQQASLIPAEKIKKFQKTFDDGFAAFNRNDFNLAIKYFTVIIENEPSIVDPFEYRAFCYFNLKKYTQSLADVERAIAINQAKASYYNLRGAAKHMMGDDPAACIDFQKAIDMGDKDAIQNVEKFCKKK